MTAREYMAYSRQRSDNIKAIIAEHKQRKGITDAMVAKAAGINPGTFVQRKRNPGTFRLNDSLGDLQRAGRATGTEKYGFIGGNHAIRSN